MPTLCLLLQVVKFARCWSTDRLNIALAVLSLIVCFTEVINSSRTQNKSQIELRVQYCNFIDIRNYIINLYIQILSDCGRAKLLMSSENEL